jgi:hypothetical protein
MDLKAAASKANLDFGTVRRIIGLYDECLGKVADIKTKLEATGIRLSRSHIAEVLDLMKLPRLKRSRFS